MHTVPHFFTFTRGLEEQRMRARWRTVPWRPSSATRQRSSGREIMPRAVVVDPLQRDLLHLADRTSFFHDYFSLVDFTNDQGSSRDSGTCVGEHNLTSIGNRLLPASKRN